MVRRNDIIAQLVNEHFARLSQIKPNNDTNVSGLLRFEFVSVLTETDMLFKTNGLQTLEVKEVNKLNDTIAQHHMLFFIASASSRCRFHRRTRPSHILSSASCSSSRASMTST